ncbi:hypothetical protein [Vibrio gazogenes]|uniref:Uncharacterized protein n=1 Tax=Vibrio gazogenes DSM 21264 = NBRC 103151 TaxID=1123492 RepID=A0A1M5BPH7_VIBGA|nr:hypothetical protein [Vibrio gazogenes]USP13714.1 hypothetical protein MKS89_15300 [Vibrio gazogenes]SHF44320.1 hypothetical protein SAMN02745781_02280 [Vibrio gazogenes DSM 21264] [Vibrio gazogenes DSM 21264 = NBRC 103151]SJN54379.1 hypothetical protein BQ6471_00978 [Vibrio gazogenes]
MHSDRSADGLAGAHQKVWTVILWGLNLNIGRQPIQRINRIEVNIFVSASYAQSAAITETVGTLPGELSVHQGMATYQIPIELPVTSTCASTEKIAVHDTADINGWIQTWSSMLLTAQAQNKKVQIYMTVCRTNNVPLLYGVRVISH